MARVEPSFAYGALRDVVWRELEVAARRSSAYVPSSTKRDALRELERSHGASGVERAGRSVSQQRGHPFSAALLACRSPAQLLRTWQRLEVFAHSSHRVRMVRVGATEAELERHGHTEPVEDRFIIAVLSGFLEAIGVHAVTAHELGAKRWRLSWSSVARAAPPAGPRVAWGAPSAFAQSVLVVLLAGAPPTLAACAKHLAVSRRTLQRRLTEAGTSFRDVVAVSRVTAAGQRLDGRASLSTVAHACGFADSAHFSREFKRLVGVPPSWFQRARAG